MARTTPIRILVADDYPLLRAGITAVLAREQSLIVCGTCNLSEETLDDIQNLKADVVVITFPLKNDETFSLITLIGERFPTTPVLVLSFKDDPVLTRRVSRSGAKGFVARTDATECLVEAIHRLARGLTYVGPKASQTLAGQIFETGQVRSAADGPSFTHRELQVLELIGSGSTPREIAQVLGLSTKTIESHRQNIKQKLGIKTAAQLARHAFQWMQSRLSP